MPSSDSQRVYAVLNGDVVDSTGLPEEVRRGLPQLLEHAIGQLPARIQAAIPHPIALFSGDSWQLLMTAPALSLRTAVAIRACLRAHTHPVDTRIVIGIGSVDFVPDDGNIALAEGEAFRISGRLLAELDQRCRMRLRLGESLIMHEPAWDAVARLMDAIILSAWTPARSRAVWGTLLELTQVDIGKLWPEPIKQSSVSERRDEAMWDAVSDALQAFEGGWDHEI